MAQTRKPQQGKRTPAYSADSMVVCLIIGLVLIALGLLVFIAAITKLDGDIFRILRVFAGGMAGTLAFALPVIPIWGGVLVIMSTQRKPPVRPFILASVLLVLLCTTVTLMTYIRSGTSLMEAVRQGVQQEGVAGDSYPAFLADAFEYGSGSRRNDGRSIGGGFLGMLLSWPLWKGLGNIFGLVIAVLAAIVAFLFLIRLDFKAIAASLSSTSQQRAALREQKRLQREQERIQREQEAALAEQQRQQQLQMQQQAQLQQQMQQQQMQQPAMPPAQPVPPAPMPADVPDPWQNMTPPGAANWNNTHGRPQAMPQRPVRRQAAPVAPMQSTAPQAKADASDPFAAPADIPPVSEPKGLFRRDKSRASAPEAPRRRRGLFEPAEDPADDVQPGEATAPRRRVATRPVPVADDFAAPQTAPAEAAPAPVQPAAAPAPAVQEAPPVIVRPEPVPEEAPAPQKAQPASPETPAQPARAVRKGSFADRMQAAMAAKGGASTAPVPAEAEPAAPVRSTRKDTPSAWSQPEAGGSASWRNEPAPARPRAAASREQATPTVWANDAAPPWEEGPDAAAPTAPQPIVKPATPPVRTTTTLMPDGAMMRTREETPYVFPSLDLLADPQPQAGISAEEDEVLSRCLENVLQSFKVPAKVRHITHGPAIRRFELELAPGVRVSKVTDLNRNIAMNLEVKSVRIEAPIPGKSLVGVEVPNHERAMVTLREVLESEPMRKATKPLVVALGKDIAGTPVICDLAKMPHLLIAGATGSGKSVCINTIINSLLYRCSPKDVRLILVDPKVVELQCYNGIPHLLVPVVSDPHKASGALAWAVGEMMDRYRRFQEAGVRAIDGYNESANEEDRMPRIVIVIDELADLMMTCKKDVEERICRLAQLARAAGIHLIVATQRPSVDVITGLIKANIPSRIAFKVSSNVDSRTILDRIGAEQLLGFGDMLYMPTGEFTPIRVQGCFLSDGEVNRITDTIRATCPGEYDPAILEELEKLQNEADAVVIPDASADDDYTGGDGSLLMQAIEMAVNDGQVSTSLIQRRLRLGYARAGRLVDEMEKRGIISQKDGAKPRLCLITREEFEVMKDSGQLD